MSILLIVLACVTALLLWYALQGREWLKTKTWAQPFFAWVEPLELALFKKSETILFARLKVVVGFLLTVLTQIGSIDLSPIIPFVPEEHQVYVSFAINLLPLLISAVGLLDEKLRKETTKPLELVAVSEKTITPEASLAIAAADEAKADAVAVVAASKAA